MSHPSLDKLAQGRRDTVTRLRALADTLEQLPTPDFYEVLVAAQPHIDKLLTEAERPLTPLRAR